jgi:hypothetical protein
MGGGSSFVWERRSPSNNSSCDNDRPIIAELNLVRVHLIKIQVENSKKEALAGGSATIRRDHPRIAMSLERGVDDPDA